MNLPGGLYRNFQPLNQTTELWSAIPAKETQKCVLDPSGN